MPRTQDSAHVGSWLTEEVVEKALGHPIDQYAHNCHAASLALLHSGLFPKARVVRGSAKGVGGQHSWLVTGNLPSDCYSTGVDIVDITLWSYDERQPRVMVTNLSRRIHRPHFDGNIMDWGCPEVEGGEGITLTPSKPLSSEAQHWLNLFRKANGRKPLDRRFWATLMTHAPYRGWPSEEITKAVYETEVLRAFIPIDRVGMHTDLNPGGLYLLPSEGEN